MIKFINMVNIPSQFIIYTSSLLLGIRHGLDWDHIAAITDITGSCENKKQGIIFGLMYACGHSAVIILLGVLAVIVGINLPDWIDNFLEPIVGITLVMLGVWLLITIYLHGKKYQLKSRWMIFIEILQKVYNKIHSKIAHQHLPKQVVYSYNYGIRTSFLIGMVHGIGAESPTQLLIIVTASGAREALTGSFIVLVFVLGLLLSNTLITLVSTYSYNKINQNSHVRLVFGTITAIFSIIVGVLFILHRATYLPVFFRRVNNNFGYKIADQ